ncbi:hypothetical protein M433DRAFT_69597 [Acidomyces richmondensis BFW]|nr:MAG: hypothetical protein FE78DRAFT_152076 [Acidomyces sp. 'richmondensis']KYG44359.1 hypothetical protein M433DRAFT_69597 [Acidomyces richmondensis BFW]
MSRYKRSKKGLGQKKTPLTHFLCLPLVTDKSRSQLERSMHDLNHEEILPVIHPKALRPVGTLHCTLGVMSLDDAGLKRATALLESLDITGLLSGDSSGQTQSNNSTVPATSEGSRSATNNASDLKIFIDEQSDTTSLHYQSTYKPLIVDLKGLMSMHPPGSTSILYSAPQDTKAEDQGRLYRFCLTVQSLFKEHRLLVEDKRPLKLHATIVNTIYTKTRGTKSRAQEEKESTLPSAPSSSTQAATTETITNFWGRTNEDDSTKSDQIPMPGHVQKAKAPLKIDATPLLERFKDFMFAEHITLDRLAICEMGAKKVFDDRGNIVGERYKEVACVKI